MIRPERKNCWNNCYIHDVKISFVYVLIYFSLVFLELRLLRVGGLNIK